jgi:phosphoglycerate dehydrogenase-like enzyme
MLKVVVRRALTYQTTASLRARALSITVSRRTFAEKMTTTKAPPLPPGKDKHHIVVLEAVHAPMPKWGFPYDITLHQRTYKGDVAERIQDATIVVACVTPVTPEDLDIAKDVRCLAIMAVGISWLDREAFAKRGITVTNCAGGNVEAVCEHFLALYFGLRKKIVELDNAMKGTKEWIEDGTLIAHWPEKKPPPGCRQEVLGIFGYGTIGKRIAVLAKALGFSEILVADRKGVPAEKVRSGRTSFDEVVKRASTHVICVPKSDDTTGMISRQEFEHMREDAIVINIARGGIVHEADFAEALKAGQIAGGAVDVLEQEPGGIGTTPLCPDPAKGEQPIPNLIISELQSSKSVK